MPVISVKLGSNLNQKRTTFPTLCAPAPTELQFSTIFLLICSQRRDKQNRVRNFCLFK